MEGRVATIVNRSEIVGRPLAAMLANDGADVYSIDIDSIYLFRGGRLHKCDGETPESCVRKSNIVITGVPTKNYCMPSEWIQPYTTIVNVASYKNVNEDENMVIEIKDDIADYVIVDELFPTQNYQGAIPEFDLSDLKMYV
jgi:methylenetetrahydrofolate dehydrogenase (NAD+)